jgi:hypothetical protein
MNPLTQFKKILTLPLLVALAVVLAALTALPAGAAPPLTCGTDYHVAYCTLFGPLR